MESSDPSELQLWPGQEARLLDGLARVNEVGRRINELRQGGDEAGVDSALRLIVSSAISMVPGSTAIIYTYDPHRRALDPVSRVAAGPHAAALAEAQPRPDGLGARSLRQQRPVLSYLEADLKIHPLKLACGAKVVGCLPLVVADQPLGVLYIYLVEDRPLSQVELLLLDSFVNQAAMALYHTRTLSDVQRSLGRKEEELAHLRHAGLLISSRSRLEDTLEAILQMALEVTGARYGIFRLVARDQHSLVTRAVAGERLGSPAVEALPINATSVMGWVAKTRQPLNIPDVQAAPWSRIYYPLDHSLEMRSELAVPLIGAGGKLEGVLNLESPEVGAFSEGDSHLLQSLATQAIIAIQEARLLDALRELAGLLFGLPAPELLRRLVELATDLLNAEAGALWTLEGDQLLLRVAQTGEQCHDDASRLPGDLALRAIQLGGPIRFERGAGPPAEEDGGWIRALVAPVVSPQPPQPPSGYRQEGRGWGRGAEARHPSGALAVYACSAGSAFLPSEWDKKVLDLFAYFAALALENETRQEELRDAQEARAVAETFAAMGDVAANLLHHLNNKVGTIPVRVEGIQDKCPEALASNPYLAANLAEIERAASDAMQAVRERLALLRPVERAPVTVAGCVEQAISAAQLPEGIRVVVDGLDQLPPVLAGKDSLTLVMENLLQNACEAMDGRGEIVISGQATSAWVEIMVRDTGPGIPLALQSRIFDFSFSRRSPRRVERSAPDSRHPETGLGFGLWWVKTLMARLGGSISVESDGPPRGGTAFRLWLPLHPRAAAESSAGGRPADGPSATETGPAGLPPHPGAAAESSAGGLLRKAAEGPSASETWPRRQAPSDGASS